MQSTRPGGGPKLSVTLTSTLTVLSGGFKSRKQPPLYIVTFVNNELAHAIREKTSFEILSEIVA